jgi:hypothetical protein
LIIHQPEIINENGLKTVLSRIELTNKGGFLPEFIWYRVPEQFGDFFTTRSDAFLIPGLLAGMHFQEDIEVRGTVSPKLAYNLEEYQNLLHFRMPIDVSPVEIRYDHLKALAAKPEAVGTAFSGGVDSFFTLWKHLPQNQPIPDFRITHAVFLHGFDILNKDRSKYEALFARYREALQNINVTLIPIETNMVSLIFPRTKYPNFYGPILAGAAHLFGKLFNKYFIPSSNDYQQLQTWASSSDPASDPLLSTETLDIIHHGAAIQRVGKIEVISDWEPAQNDLRVCINIDLEDGLINCSRCEKCVRTMIPLYAMGKMEKFKTFQKPIRSDRESLWWARKFDPSKYFVKESSHGFIKETLTFVRKHKSTMIPWLRVAIILGTIRHWCLKLVPKSVQTRLQRFGYYKNSMIQEGAFENIEINDAIESSKRNGSERI